MGGAVQDTVKAKCKKCSETKSITEFGQTRGKLKSSCKLCDSVYRKAHYLANRDHTLAVNKKWANKNPDNVRERSARWYRENTERHHELMAASYQRHRDERILRNRAWYRRNAKRRAVVIKAWQKRNAERLKAASVRYRQNHPDRTSAANALCRQYRGRAAPHWLTKQQKAEMRGTYRKAQHLTKETGVPHHVDHIVPIRGKIVCGLHVPWNLQILTAFENQSKSNSHTT
jgi:hypothetical protein